MTLHDELQRIADRAPVADVPDDTWSRARTARTRELTLIVAGVAAVLALITAAVVWIPTHREPPVAGTGSLGVPDHLHAVPERMSDRENDGSWLRDEVTDDLTVVGVGAAAWVTDQGLPVVVDAERGDYHLLDLPDFVGNNQFAALGLGNPVVALSPDGRQLAYGYAVFGPDAATAPIPTGIRVVDLRTGEQRRQIPVPGKEGTAISQIEWSPDGTWLAFTGRQQDTWTTQNMGGTGPGVLGRVPPDSDEAEVEQVNNDQDPLSVDDDGTIARDQASLGDVGELTLQRADNELQLTSDAEDGYFTVGAVEPGVGDDLSVAVDLMTPGLPTVERPKPHWPWSEERISITIGLGVAAVIAAYLGLRRLVRRYRAAR
jgi:hypothetical protein